MIRRLSTLLIATRREPPADAPSVGQALLVRAGMLHQVGPGLVVLAPLLTRVVQRIEVIARAQLAGVGSQELRTPRAGTQGEPGPSHDEQVARLAAERLSSHRQLPQIVHVITSSDVITTSDQAGARSGLAHARDATVCDVYSFAVDEASSLATYERLADACEGVFRRCGLDVLRAASGSARGGSEAFLAPAAGGEQLVAVSDAGRFRATAEVARAALRAPEKPEQRRMTRVETPAATTMEALAPFVTDVPPERMVKTLLYASLTEERSEVVAALCRGDRSVDEAKLARALGATEVGLADAATIRDVTGAAPGYAGPVGLPDAVRRIGDHALADVQGFVCGANADDAHLRDVWWGRDVELPELADLDRVGDGDPAPDGGTITLTRALEVGHARLLGTDFADTGGVSVAGPDGVERPVWTSSHRLAVERLAAALVEQRGDEAGIAWPVAVAPHTAVVVTVRTGDDAQDRLSEQVTAELLDAGVDAVWDDRDARAGVKFTDAELIGFPWRITVGRDAAAGRVELTHRAGGDTVVLEAAEAVRRVADAAAEAGVPHLP